MPIRGQRTPVSADNKPGTLFKAAGQFAFDSGKFINTKFFVFSRRSKSGKVYKPQAVYANSWILKKAAPTHFESLLGEGFDKDVFSGSMDTPFPDDQEVFASNYDYDSDSDLEQDDDTAEEPTAAEASKRTKTSPVGEKEQETELAKADVPKSTGKVVILRHVAYPTWRALVNYLSMGEIKFAPLRSQAECKNQSYFKLHEEIQPYGPFMCSPKSMYRLADELDIQELKKLALADIRSKLSPENISQELFSEFTSIYDEVRDAEIAYMCQYAKTAIIPSISECLDSAKDTGLGKSGEILKHLVVALVGRV